MNRQDGILRLIADNWSSDPFITYIFGNLHNNHHHISKFGDKTLKLPHILRATGRNIRGMLKTLVGWTFCRFFFKFKIHLAWNLYEILWLPAIANNKNHGYLSHIVEQHMLQMETVKSFIFWGESILTCQRQAFMCTIFTSWFK